MRIWKDNWLSFIRYGMLMLLVVFIVALLGADKRLYGLNVNDYEGVVLYISDSNMGAEELLIVKLADTSQAEAVESAVQTRIENQENSFEGYGVEQYQLLQEHVLDVEGNYVFFMVHKEAQKAQKAFLNNL